MRLTSLEIKGFKSFADKQVIHFDHDVVAIMGSNGCGKSNIVDAIRWVLGEQKTKTLRLEKMENIIFNGTKDRKAGNMAQVSLTFDNTKNILPTEFNTVIISRTLYRTGESEYQINGVHCRLKDIRNLFLDTGIASSTYAIMELKMIDDILNDVEDSRRLLIEQAAGISKYKTRKKETFLKLNSTETDLNRVNDLLFEIENNLKTLESQAKKAHRYKKIKEEYKLLSIDISKYEMLNINDLYELIELELKGLQDDRLTLDTQVNKREADLQRQKMLIIEREKSLSEQQKKLNDFIISIQTIDNDKKIADQKSDFLNNRTKQLKEQFVTQSNEEKLLQTDIEEVQNRISKEIESLQTFKNNVDIAKTDLETQRIKSLAIKDQLDQQRNQYNSIHFQLSETEKLLAIRESKMENLKSSNQRSLFEKEEKLEVLKKLDVEVKKIQENIKKQQELINSMIGKEAENIILIDKLEASIESKRNEVMDSKRVLDAKNNEFKLTKNMIDSLEGFPDSIKFLKKKGGWLEHIPLLSDLIYCNARYRVALEIILKPYLNHFVVKTEEEANQSIQLLSDSNKGRAHFFVLDYFINSKQKITKPKTQKGQIAALEVIDLDKNYEFLFNYLLRDVVIVEKEIDFVFETTSSYSFVDESGKWLKSAVEISGGAVGLFEGKRLGRLKNLEKLETEIEVLLEKVGTSDKFLKQDKDQLTSLKNNSFRTTIEREQREIQKMERDLVSFTSRIENSQEFVNQHSKRQEEVLVNINELEKEISKFQKGYDKAKIETNINKLKLDALEIDFKAASLQFTQLQEKFNEKNILFIQNENALQSYRQSLQYKSSRLATVLEELNKNSEEFNRAAIEIEHIKVLKDDLDQQLIELYKERDKKKEDLSGHEIKYYELKENVQIEENTIRDFNKQKEELDWNINQKKDKKVNLKYELQSLQQRLSLEFKVDVEELLNTIEKPELEKAELEIKLSKALHKIENFGEVNPMAEAAYDEIKKRFDFITEQKNDLVESRATLLATIQEIESIAKEQFMDAFVAIREHFKNVFRAMFNEHDNCDLLLADPDNPLESKVEIIAKPKGKRPQSINQLSGGEKSLTALSLLFALYLHKPAPFCILDEIDAPLDLANIEKFNKVIREFSKSSQFIVVSHQEETGAAADVVHGVTMHKAGISMLVSTDFKNLDKKTPIKQAS